MTDNTCRLCTRPTRDLAYACDSCGDQFAADLKALHDWLEQDLETSVAGAKGVRYGGGSGRGSGESGLRVNYRAAELYRRLGQALASAVDFCLETHVSHVSPTEAPPAPSVRARALWLTWRVDGLCLRPQGPDHIRDITRLVEQARELVFFVPPTRTYLGPCEMCGEASVYVEGEAAEAYCSRCEAAFPAEVRRAQLLAELDDRRVTAAEVAKLSTYLGLHCDRDRVRKRVNQWSKRGVIAEVDGTYRFGDVWPRLVAAEG